MEKNNNNTNYENPLTGEKVAKVNQQKEITKDPVDEIVHYGGEKYHKVIKMNLIQTHRKVAKKKFEVNQVSKSRYRRSCNTPVDDVTKYGPVDGDPIIEKKRFRLIKT